MNKNELVKKENQVVTKKLNPIDATLEKVHKLMDTGDLRLPPNYSVENAMKSARLILENTKTRDKRSVLADGACTKVSLYNSLMNMAIQGLNPAKNQCYFIPYGNELTLIRSYFGTELVIKRLYPGAIINTQVVYEGDSLDISIDDFGMTNISNHKTSAENKNNKIVGAYCKIFSKDKELLACEYMTIEDIKRSWQQSKTYNSTSVHAKFPQEMAKRTVINRTCKHLVNNADDDYLVAAFNETTKNEYISEPKNTIKLENTNKGTQGLKERIAQQKAIKDEIENPENIVSEIDEDSQIKQEDLLEQSVITEEKLNEDIESFDNTEEVQSLDDIKF